MDFRDSAEEAAFRTDVRTFIDAELPTALREAEPLEASGQGDAMRDWRAALAKQGWIAPHWPKEYGGGGFSVTEQFVFNEEMAESRAPDVGGMGVQMIGPILIRFGSEEQRQEHLSRITGGEAWWCQGYSEPGAGSDLAALKTVAERDGDSYVVNGSKMWTTEAHWADKMHCLVRTDRSVKPQKGISFLLIDMDTPGITVQPIVTIDGIHHTNQVFFDNVRVPVSNRVGEEGQGWSIAKFLLDNERVSIADTGPKLRLLRHLRVRFAELKAADATPLPRLTLLEAQLAELSAQLLTLCALERRYIERWSQGATPGAEASILKIRGTEVLQALAELALALEGPLAAAHDPADLHRDADQPLTPAQRASLLGHEYLYSRCWSIFGGTNEIQRNVIGRDLLAD